MNILVIGATSAIAQACAREWLTFHPGCRLILTGRDTNKLASMQEDLLIRGAAEVDVFSLDIMDSEACKTVIESAVQKVGHLDRVLVAPGSLPDQQRCQTDEAYAAAQLSVNSTRLLLLLEQLAHQLEQQRHGRLVAISSVAGDRGRMSNYFYGAAKAAVTAFCSGLMMRLEKSGVTVSVVKPGFVRTPMTAGLDLPQRLVASPEAVAKAIVKGCEGKKAVIYAPGFWLLIMTVIRLIPTAIFRKLTL